MLKPNDFVSYVESGDTSSAEEVAEVRPADWAPTRSSLKPVKDRKRRYLTLPDSALSGSRRSSPSTEATTVRSLPSMRQVEILGARMHCSDLATTANWLLRRIKAPDLAPTLVVHLNAYNFYCLTRSPELLQDLSERGVLLFDGLGLKLAGSLHGFGWLPDVNGTDLFPLVMAGLAGKRSSVYFLGTTSANISRVAENVAREWPSVQIAGFHSGYFSAQEEASVVDEINGSGAQLLIIARGCPLQEKFALDHLKNLKVNAIWTVGGLFDFVSGAKPRAPSWVRAARLEWLYRFKVEPKRMWRRVSVVYPWFIYRSLMSGLVKSQQIKAASQF